jgi:diguanylate cyclase (GGDEF)-like protein/PAS domain S-box-containing protein
MNPMDPRLPLALIVDDDLTFRTLFRMSLDQLDLRVEEAASGQEAIELATMRMPDIVILDMQMPDMDGFTTCQRLRQLPGGDVVPILVITGLDDVESIAHAYDMGATDFIIKPCHGLILNQRVRYMLRAGQTLSSLRSSESRLAQAQRIAHLGGWEWDLAHDRMVVSDTVCQMLGLDSSSFGQTPLTYLACVHEEDRVIVAESMKEAVKEGTGFDLDHRVIQTDGTERIVHFQGTVVPDDVGRPQQMVGTVQDVTDTRATEAKVYFLANYDSLTHLPNRHLFLHHVAHAITCGMGIHVIGAVMVMNLDRFQRLIDTFGHRGSEQLLKELAERWQHTISTGTPIAQSTGADTAILARLSEDQFALLVNNLTTAEDSVRVAQTLLASLSVPFQLEAASVTLAANIGVAIPGTDGTDADVLVRHATTALNTAATKGRNTYQYYSDSMNVSIAARVGLEQDLRVALSSNQFVLYYQPQMDILSETVIGVEALIRWQHPTRGLILPSEFIQVAEEEDLIVQLSEWVFKSVAQQQRMWKKNGWAPFTVSVNLSSLHFRQRHIAHQIKSLVYEHGGDPHQLELELTEGVLMADTSTTVATLKLLKEAGFRLAIDDFGTGYSSLAYLQRFPIDTLKIDRAFLKDLTPGKGDSPIIRAIIGMGRALRLHIVAEGVETQEQLAFLRMQGCPAYQGYLFSKPVPPNQLLPLLRKHLPQPTAKSA